MRHARPLMSRSRARLTVAGLLCVVVMAALVACGGRASEAQTPETPLPQAGLTDEPAVLPPTATPVPRELIICVGHEPALRPGSGDPAGEAILRLLSPQAAVFGTDYSAESDLLAALPDPAEGTLRRNEDGSLTVTLRYRGDLIWSDGEPFDAADARLGLLLPASPYAPIFDVLDVRQIDDLTLEVRVAEEAEYPYVPSQPPLPAHALTGDVDPALLAEASLLDLLNPALGPYVFAGADSSGTLRFEVNPYYPGAESLIPAVTVRVIRDAAQVWSGLIEEGCDVAFGDALDLSQQRAADTSGPVVVHRLPGPVYEQVIFNTYTADTGRVPYLADPRVRQAIAHAVDRTEVAGLLWPGSAPVLDSWLPADHWAYAGTAQPAQYAYDPDLAARLLDEAGWRDEDGDGTREYYGEGGTYSCQRGDWSIEEGAPLLVSLAVPDGDALREQIADWLVQGLRQVGVTVNVQRIPPDVLFSREGPLVQREFDMALLAGVARPDPGGISRWVGTDVFRHPQTRETVHRWDLEERFLRPELMVERLAFNNVPAPENDYQGQNYSGWCNEDANIAIVEANLGLDIATRQVAYAQQQAIFAVELPVLPLFARPIIAANVPDLCGVSPGPWDPLTWNITAWHFDESGACDQ